MPGVAAVKQQHRAIAAFGADRLDQCCCAVETAKTAIGAGQRFVIDHGVRVGKRRSWLDREMTQKILPDEMRRDALEVCHPKIL